MRARNSVQSLISTSGALMTRSAQRSTRIQSASGGGVIWIPSKRSPSIQRSPCWRSSAPPGFGHESSNGRRAHRAGDLAWGIVSGHARHWVRPRVSRRDRQGLRDAAPDERRGDRSVLQGVAAEAWPRTLSHRDRLTHEGYVARERLELISRVGCDVRSLLDGRAPGVLRYRVGRKRASGWRGRPWYCLLNWLTLPGPASS